MRSQKSVVLFVLRAPVAALPIVLFALREKQISGLGVERAPVAYGEFEGDIIESDQFTAAVAIFQRQGCGAEVAHIYL